jgi:N6-adenosine-specific RNA methylase IME4
VRFGTIIADPPWAYSGTSGDKRLRGYSDSKYKPLKTRDLADLPVNDISADDAVLFIWTNGPFLADGSAQLIAKSWGFEPVTLCYWHKTRGDISLFGNYTHSGGVGYWFRGNCEPVLVAKKGKAYRWSDMPGWGNEDKNALFERPKMAHSRKPDVLHERIERSAYPKPYLELFARRARSGWTTVGDEIPGFEGEDIRVSVERLKCE